MNGMRPNPMDNTADLGIEDLKDTPGIYRFLPTKYDDGLTMDTIQLATARLIVLRSEFDVTKHAIMFYMPGQELHVDGGHWGPIYKFRRTNEVLRMDVSSDAPADFPRELSRDGVNKALALVEQLYLALDEAWEQICHPTVGKIAKHHKTEIQDALSAAKKFRKKP